MVQMIEARRLSAGYGDMPIVHDLDLMAEQGEVIALLGPNGAGKTTALLTLAGVLSPMGGEVLIDGRRVTSDLSARARNGLALVMDDRSIFRELTVAENLRLGNGNRDLAVKTFPALGRLMNRRAGLLSGGEQQMLGLGRALARKPRVLLIDELSLGLAPIVVRDLLVAVRAAADNGTAVVLVEQQVRLVLEVCDRAYVLQRGRLSLTGTAAELREQPELIERSYLATDGDSESCAGAA